MSFRQPAWPRHLPRPLTLGLATLGPIGMRLPAPGTWGSLAGLFIHLVLVRLGGPWASLAFAVLGSAAAIGLCGEAEVILGRTDPGQVILDEVVAMPLCFVGFAAGAGTGPGAWGHPWALPLAGFALFRLFDIAKPLGIGRLQALPSGWGVVVDDLAAALAACLVLHLIACFFQLT